MIDGTQIVLLGSKMGGGSMLAIIYSDLNGVYAGKCVSSDTNINCAW